MEITKEVYNHVVIFKDKSQKWVNDNVYQNLLKLGDGGKFSVDGGIYDYNMVAKVLDRGEFYEEYPDNRPSVLNEFEPSRPVKLNNKRRELILAGIEEAVGKNDFYDLIKKRIAKKDYLNTRELMGS